VKTLHSKQRWIVGVSVAAAVVALGVWLILADTHASRFVLRLYQDKELLRETLQQWEIMAPLVFILLQALQVVIAPIPGDVTGLLGGLLFGQWLGFFYSTVGLTAGSLLAFWVGRQLGAPFVERLVKPQTWNRLGFIVEAEGAILCFVIFLIPGLPKDTLCYLFGLSPMPFWTFAVVSTLGRMPGTWVLSAQGAKVATGQYVELALISALVAAVAIPLYYYRDRIVSWVRG
jgi:uncharacterized membrane protein YdjX (TVP38/TMEM64 family)